MTYSIVAVDPQTGNIGVAVQSCSFAVAHYVPFARAGIGAVATQAFTNTDYGEQGLKCLMSGDPPDVALQKLISRDQNSSIRQVAIINSKGDSAVFTGQDCIPYAGHCRGPGYSIQANLMRTPAVWGAMEENFLSSSKSFSNRLLDSLEAGEAAGGDLRGQQSASLLVVGSDQTANATASRVVELHVYDHPSPLKELRRLLDLHQGMELAERGFKAYGENNIEHGSSLIETARRLLPHNFEIGFWYAVELARTGSSARALEILRPMCATSQDWKELAMRLIGTKKLNLRPEDLQI